MHNDKLEKLIESTKKELPNHWTEKEFEKFKQAVIDKNKEFEEFEEFKLKLYLSDFSTTELKAELRRRKKERR